ncbi:MAG: SRPBCC family protein [Geminicoccaceae bacterium]
MPKVTMSTPVAMNADALWQAIGSFAAIGQWHPMMERVDSNGETKGSLRTLRLIGGAKLVERLEEVSPTERLYRYSILESPLPISNYFSEIRVKDNGDGSSTVEWSSDFNVNTSSERDVVKTVQEVYQAGLDNLSKLYGFGGR